MSINLLFADAHPRLNLTVAQAHQSDLVTQIAAIALEIDAIGRQPAAQLIDADLVLASDIGHRLVNRRIIDPDAGFGGRLHLDPLGNQGLQGRARQVGGSGRPGLQT